MRSDIHDATQHGEGHAPTGAAFAIDGGGVLLDSGDGCRLELQMFVRERHLVVAVEVVWAGFVYRRLIGRRRWLVKALVAASCINGGVGRLSVQSVAALVHGHLV